MLGIINEPTAAAIAYGLDKKESCEHVLIEDIEKREKERERERERERGRRVGIGVLNSDVCAERKQLECREVDGGLVHGEIGEQGGPFYDV